MERKRLLFCQKKLLRRSTVLVDQALTHKSYHNENVRNSAGHNERLEFLGDAVLDLVLSDLLFEKYPESCEGMLSKARSSLVNEGTLAQLALTLKVDEELLLGVGEKRTGGHLKPRLLASAFEALIGACYLDLGFQETFEVIESLYKDWVIDAQSLLTLDEDYKTHFQEKSQKFFRLTPKYQLIETRGLDHEREFFVHLFLGESKVSEGEGKSKKRAEQKAAQNALDIWETLLSARVKKEVCYE